MCLFLETICIDRARLQNVRSHLDRIKRTRNEFFQSRNTDDFEKLIESIPPITDSEKYKLRIEYNSKILKYSLEPYTPRKISAMYFVEAADLQYNFKFCNRKDLLLLKASCKPETEIIITQNSFVTDTTYSNLAFYRKGKWFTPETYLLPGTKRNTLIKKGELQTAQIHRNDVKEFEKVSLINAMLDLGDLVFPTKEIQMENDQ